MRGLSGTCKHEVYVVCSLYILFVPLVRHTLTAEPSSWYAAYTKQVRFGGLAPIDVLFASSK